MAGSKVVVKKPLRRYERAFDQEKEVTDNIEDVQETTPIVNPDITSPAGITPVMNAKKLPVRYKVKVADKQAEQQADGKDEDVAGLTPGKNAK
jgi:hypothetical protein